VLNLKIPRTLNSHVVWSVRLLKCPLQMAGLQAMDARSQTDARSSRGVVRLRVLRSRILVMPVEQVLEIRPSLFEAGRVHVGQGIGNHVQFGLERFHAAGSGVESLDTHGRAEVRGQESVVGWAS